VKISGVDLNVFEFDYDLNFFVFFLNADEKVFGRYGGRDAGAADKRLSLKGLRHAMNAALEAHRREPAAGKAPPRKKPQTVDDYPAAKAFARQCIHCHQVNEIRRAALKAEGKWDKELVWAYPLPENVGVVLDVDRGDSVRSVTPGSPADRAGLRVGDVVTAVNGTPVASIADFQYGLHRAPGQGKVPVEWKRDGKPQTADLDLADGWRRTNITWRASLLAELPTPEFDGDDLSAAEKKALGLGDKRLAFRLGEPDPASRRAGLREGDVVLGFDGKDLDLTLPAFLGHIRRNYLAGERVEVNVIRDGKRVNVPMTLP
jgi:hypothetical protein